MNIKEIERIYAQYKIETIRSDDLKRSSEITGQFVFKRIQPPSAYAPDKQIISNKSTLYR